MVYLENIVKDYRTRQRTVRALDNVNLRIKKEEFVLIRGPSGSVKTTLLMTIAGMQRPTDGKVIINQNDLYAINAQARVKFRAQNISLVFQMFHLVPYLSVIENVLLPTRAAGRNTEKVEIKQLLEKLGIAERAYHKPSQLSAGEKQRTAIARALVISPEIILADEPTGNLDPDNATVVLSYLVAFQRSGGTIILTTHSNEANQYASQMINLKNGRIDNCAAAS